MGVAVTTRVLLVTILVALAASTTAAASPPIAAQRARAHAVEQRVSTLGVQLESVVQRWDGERAALQRVDGRLQRTTAALHIAHRNLRRANARLEQRLVLLYVSPPPGTVEILAGSKSISDLIDAIETAQSFSRQDKAIAGAARRYQGQLVRTRTALRRERRNRAALASQLATERTSIANGIAAQRRLLASIHESIATLIARQAAEQRRQAALRQREIARRVAAARARAAAQVVQQAAPPVATPPPATATPAPAPAPTPAPAAPAPPSAHASAASIAARYLGVPYVWGGASPGGFDCSGLVMYVYAQLGVALPHYTVAQWNATTPIPTSALEPGDLVFFDGLGHVGIYIGGGQFIHAPHTGTVVQIASLSGYWAAHLDGARRVQ